MKRETTIANEMAIIDRKLEETKNQVAIEALKAKRKRLKDELNGMKLPAHTLAKKLLAEQKLIKQLSKIEFNDLIRQLAKKPEYAFLKTMSKQTIRNDIERKAKPVGWRFKGRGNYDTPTKKEIESGKKNGTVYKEKRPLRSDVSRVAKLKKGGNIKTSIAIGDKVKIPTQLNVSHIEQEGVVVDKIGAFLIVQIGEDKKSFHESSVVKA